MRGIATCYSQHAIKVSDFYCSGPSRQSFQSPNHTSSNLDAVSSVYRAKISSQRVLFLSLSWYKNLYWEGPVIGIGESLSSLSKISANSHRLLERKGSKVLYYETSKIEIFWDLSKASYGGGGPEPTKKFYITILVDSEMCIVLGDMQDELDAIRLKSRFSPVKLSLVSRNEYFSGNSIVYSTKAKFSDAGMIHDIVVRCCSGEQESSKGPVLLVEIDKKTVSEVKNLRWNFRGNQTIFVDRLLVDMMWDVHDWFFNPKSGRALFLFRTRSGFDSRLWLEEKNLDMKKQDNVEFSLLISASRNPG